MIREVGAELMADFRYRLEELTETAPLSPVKRSVAAMARDISHKSQPGPPTDQSVQVPPQIPTASEPGKA